MLKNLAIYSKQAWTDLKLLQWRTWEVSKRAGSECGSLLYLQLLLFSLYYLLLYLTCTSYLNVSV